jgi:hypothetical protein
MGTRLLFPSFSLTRFQQRAGWFFLGLAILLLCSGWLGLAIPLTGAHAQTHGCAPDVPPTVSDTIPAQALPGNILINEVLSQPKSNWNCSEPSTVFSQPQDSWIELFNPQNRALNLYQAHAQLSLNGGSTSMYFPFGTSIAAGGFLVIFPLEKQTVALLNNWNILLSIDGVTIDQATLPQLAPDQSYARVPDGSTTWLYAGNPTIAASNNAIGQPVTPTPTKTPKLTSTPGTNETPQPSNFGTQPPWSQVRFPVDPSPTFDSPTTPEPAGQLPGQPQDPPAPQSNSPNGWILALIAFLSLLFLSVLGWIWRLFRTS